MGLQPTRKRVRTPAGFTLVEAMVSITIAAMAGSALLLGVNGSLQATTEALEQTIAAGMAEQLMDEVVGARYCAVGEDGYQVNLGASGWELSGSGRERFNDIDDYNQVRCQPPESPRGIELGSEDGEGDRRHPNFQVAGGYLDNWRHEIDVYYIDGSDLTTRLSAGQTSDYRMVEVRITLDFPGRDSRELATLRRVVAYVPPM